MATITEYSSSFCEKLFEHAESGRSVVSFRGKERISKATWDKWIEEHAEFRDAVDIGICISYGYWESQLVGKSEDGTSEDFFEKASKNILTLKESRTLAYNMLKQLDTQSFKVTGTSMMLGDTKTDEEDLTSYGSSDVYADMMKPPTDDA